MEHLLAERVKEIMDNLEFTPSGFADTIDVPRPIISHILSGRNKPSLDVIQKILMRFPELNPWWLLTGKGNMKQLNLFSEEELESVSIKPTIQHHQHSASNPTLASDAAPVRKTPPPAQQPEEAQSQPSSQSHSSETNFQEPFPINKNANPSSMSMRSGEGKTIEKMIVFYTDKSFSVYHPE